jgi:hypothetical protein
VPVDNALLPHHLEQFDPILPAPQKSEEISGSRFLYGIESENIREGRIAGHDLPVSAHDERAGEIFHEEAPILLQTFA